ncbi:MAG: hypothetical protein ABH870_06335 [bacterium]
MLKPAYKLTIGSTTIDSLTEPTSSLVISIQVRLDMDIPADSFNITLAQGNELSVNRGDNVIIELGDKDSMVKVIEGTIVSIEPSITQTKVIGLNAISKLLDLRINQVYEKQTAGAITADLAGQAEVTVGEKEDGIEFPFYTIDSARNGYEHIRDLARRCGGDVYLTAESRLVFKGFTKTSADHIVEYGKEILEFEKYTQEEVASGISVFGESPASSQGAETSHWLTKDFKDYKGTTGTGLEQRIEDATIKTKDAADMFAQAELKAIKKNTVSGMLKILGNANIKLGDAIEIKGMPNDEMNGVFQVRGVGHYLSKDTGFITRIGIRGLDG